MTALVETLSSWTPELLRTSLQGAVLVAVILAVQWAFAKRLSPAWRHALWGLLFVRLLLVWAPSSPLSVYNLTVREVPVAEVAVPATITNTEIAPMSVDPVGRENSPSSLFRDNRDFSDGRDSGASGDLDFWAAASIVWFGFFATLLMAMAGQSLHLSRKVRAGRLVTDSATLELLEQCRATLRVSPFLALVETDCVRSPALLGCIRPKLLLPCGFLDSLTREEMRHVFLHELAHVKRGDIWSGWLFNLLLAVHWFNPALWLARYRFIADREAACDAHVLAALDAAGQRDYGHTVLNLTQRFKPSPWAPGMAGISETSSNLKRRITMIKHFRPPTRLAAWSGAGLCVCIGLATLTNAQVETANTPAPTPSEEESAAKIEAIRQQALDFAEHGKYLEAITLLDRERFENASVFDEFSARIVKLKLDGGLPLTVNERKLFALVEGDRFAIEWRTGAGENSPPGDRKNWIDDLTSLDEVVDEIALVEALQAKIEREPMAEIHEYGIEAATLADSRVSALQLDLARSEMEVEKLRSTHFENHPTMKARTRELEVMRLAVAKQAAALRSSALKSLHAELSERYRRLARDASKASMPTQSELPADASGEGACANNMKQLGIFLKKFATENDGLYPPLSPKPGLLMYAWSRDTPDLPGGPVLSPQISTDIPFMTKCPATEGAFSYGQPHPNDYVYLGYLVRNDRDVQNFSEAYTNYFQSEEYALKPFSGFLPLRGNKIFRLQKGIERFLITDINDPAGGSAALSRVPLLIEWPKRHIVAPGKQGGNVLFMDGHVEFMPYPGEWPMTEETISILCELAGREPIKKME